MKIVSFSPNINSSALVLKLEDAELAYSLLIWSDEGYKDYDMSIDLSYLLNGNKSQTIVITPELLNKSSSSGVYTAQVEDNINLAEALTGVYLKYEECILNKLKEISLCDDCLERESLSLVNSQTLLVGLKLAVKQGFIEEAKRIRKALDKYCSNDCMTCGKYPNILNNNYYDYNA